MSQLRVLLERRALVVLMVWAGVDALFSIAMDVLADLRAFDSSLVMNVFFAFMGIASVALFAATASYVATSPQRTIGRIGFGFLLGVIVCRHAIPLVMQALPSDARDAVLEHVHGVFIVLTAVGYAGVLTAIALSSRGPARAIGLTLAGLALAIPLASILLSDTLRGDAWSMTFVVLTELAPVAACFVRWRVLGRTPADEDTRAARTADRQPELRRDLEDWQVAASGAATLRAAVILQIVLVAALLALGLLAALGRGSGAGAFAFVLVLVGLLGAVAVVVLYLVGLGRLAKIPWASEARAAFSAAFQVTLLNCFLGLLLLVAAAIVLVGSRAGRESQEFLRECQQSMSLYGLVAGASLLFGLRRVAIRLAAPRLRGLAVTTLLLQVAGYLPNAVLQILQERAADVEPSSGVVTALGVVGAGLGIAAWACLLVALRELRTTLSGSELADAFGRS